MSTVYFIQRGDHDGPIKIGFTGNNVAKRLRALKSLIKAEVFLLAVMPGTIEKEKSLHKKFAKHALGNEWFSVAPEIVRFIKKLESGLDWCARTKTKSCVLTRTLNN